MTAAYPLTWPAGFPRAARREKGRFQTKLGLALSNVKDSLRLFGHDSGKPISDVVMSSNVTLGEASPADPGVAVYFTWEGMQVCIPVDRDGVTTNGIESVFAVLKRGLIGVYHHASPKHLHRYVDEFAFRLNEGNVERHTLDRLESFVAGTAGKRLTYKAYIQ